ncbi:MAG: hypothetical protein HXY40_08175 [Chloroflexi bacterium]|nr:hypothetical protein [Chloroflexota bacterium]
MDEQTLRQEGYLPYRKRALTYAKQMKVPFKVRLKNDDTIYGAPGDYVCTNAETSERWIVAENIFEESYHRLSKSSVALEKRSLLLEHYHFNLYRKTTLTWARQITRPMTVNTLEGPVSAQPGDYLCIGTQGEQWPQMRQRFEENYEIVEEASAPD